MYSTNLQQSQIALAQNEFEKQLNIITFQPKFINQTLDIARTTLASAREFNLGGKPISLGLDTRPRQQMAMVQKFSIRPNVASKIGRQENIVECISSAITNRSSRAELDRYLSSLRVSSYVRENAQFYFVSARSIKDEGEASKKLLSRKKNVLNEEHFILGLVQEKEDLKIALIPSGKRGTVLVNYSALVRSLEVDDREDNPEEEGDGKDETDSVISYPDDPKQDFAVCYNNCLEDIPEWLLAVVSGICAGCVTLVGVAATTGGVATPVLIGACAGCVVAIGEVFGNCLLTCHEMFGQ